MYIENKSSDLEKSAHMKTNVNNDIFEIDNKNENMKNHDHFKKFVKNYFSGDWNIVRDYLKSLKQDDRKKIEGYFATGRNEDIQNLFKLVNEGKLEKDKIINTSGGSTGAQSDIDINLKGQDTESAVIKLNEQFRKDHFGIESGTFYDVNFYAVDFLPNKYRTEGAADPSDHKFASEKAKNKVKQMSIISSLTHLYSVMEVGDEKMLVGGKFEEVILKSQHFRRNIELGKNPNLKEENAKYEEKLKCVKEAREEYEKLSKSKEISGDKFDEAYIALYQAKLEALRFANEAYYSEGAVRHTVQNKQMYSNMYKTDIENKTKKNSDKIQNQLSNEDYFSSLNEQIAMALHLCTPKTEVSEIMLKIGKYVHRAMNALKHLLPENEREKYRERTHAAALWEGIKQGMSHNGEKSPYATPWFSSKIYQDKNSSLTDAKEFANTVFGSRYANFDIKTLRRELLKLQHWGAEIYYGRTVR